MLDENCPIEEVRELFGNDRFATEACGCRVLEASRGHAVCAFDIEPIHLNAMGNVMGGAVFMLGDFAFAVASNFGKRPTVSTTSQITFLRAAKGNSLTARAELVKEGRTAVYYEVSVTDEPGNLVARLTASGQIVE